MVKSKLEFTEWSELGRKSQVSDSADALHCQMSPDPVRRFNWQTLIGTPNEGCERVHLNRFEIQNGLTQQSTPNKAEMV